MQVAPQGFVGLPYVPYPQQGGYAVPPPPIMYPSYAAASTSNLQPHAAPFVRPRSASRLACCAPMRAMHSAASCLS